MTKTMVMTPKTFDGDVDDYDDDDDVDVCLLLHYVLIFELDYMH